MQNYATFQKIYRFPIKELLFSEIQLGSKNSSLKLVLLYYIMSETQTEQKKKGGPYNKNDKDGRQLEVRRPHFEYGYSAVKISEMMKVNRNTINSDIKFWYDEISNEWKDFDIKSWYIKQLERLESTRARLMEQLDAQEELKSRLGIEKMIFDIDCKISDMISKIKVRKKHGFSEFWN